jgi:signal transduction histidine kinase
MKLSTKLTLFISSSKLVVVLLFLLALPFLIKQIGSKYTTYTLKKQRKKVLGIIQKNGLEYYFQGDKTYGSYTMLKEEFVALSSAADDLKMDTIAESKRLIESDTLNYKVLSYTFKNKNKNYLLEIGKTTEDSNQYYKPLQRFALYILFALIVLTILIDLTFTRIIISPLSKIINTRLVNSKFPFKLEQIRIKTGTADFRYLDESLISLMSQINDAFYKEREFTSNASHELMTPISVLQSKMENLLAEENLNETSSIAIVEMMKTVSRLKNITRSLLLISRIENEQFIKKENVNLFELLTEITDEISHRLEEKHLKIHLKIPKDSSLNNINRDLIFQLFFNLIHNAIKFNSDGGSITIENKNLKDGTNEITVADTGIGIPTTDLPFIFDRFKKTNLKEDVGYGLGLAIVKSIAVYHNLKIEVYSEINKGTTFKIT